MDLLDAITSDETARQNAFPVAREKIFMGHAAVTPLPRAAVNAVNAFLESASTSVPELTEMVQTMQSTREAAARLIHCTADEIALLGPTSLGLSLFANGLTWQPGDEVVCYFDDYPANVYPWLNLQTRGVTVRFVKTLRLGEITPEHVAATLTERTRLVALASCHFVSGFRLEVEAIGQLLHERGILFSLDAIQTLGAFATTVEHVDFLSADAHKWLLGPLAMGIVYVRKACFELCRPSLLGSWNVKHSNYSAQSQIEFAPSAQRYEPGAMNLAGIVGMKASLELLAGVGLARVTERILHLCARLGEGLRALGFSILGRSSPIHLSGILTATHPARNIPALHEALRRANVLCSCRHDRAGTAYLRFSPHFYNTSAEIDHVLGLLEKSA